MILGILGYKGFHCFRKDINPKMNVIAQLEFEIRNYNVEFQHVSNFPMEERSEKFFPKIKMGWELKAKTKF